MVQDEDATMLRLSGKIFSMYLDDFALFLDGFWDAKKGPKMGPGIVGKRAGRQFQVPGSPWGRPLDHDL